LQGAVHRIFNGPALELGLGIDGLSAALSRASERQVTAIERGEELTDGLNEALLGISDSKRQSLFL